MPVESVEAKWCEIWIELKLLFCPVFMMLLERLVVNVSLGVLATAHHVLSRRLSLQDLNMCKVFL